MNLEGGCACGAARYAVSGKPLIVHACHCKDCQRLGGSAFAVNAWFRSTDVALTSGKLRTIVVKGGSGKDHVISACDDCGTQLWGQYTAAPAGSLFLRTGTLDEGHELQPDAHIYTRSKRPWVVIPEGIPQFTEFYNPKNVWPAESLARLNETSRES